MRKREQGILTVEASAVLTLMMFFILFLFSFGRVYRAQSLVSHATLQAADAIALESYLRETALQSDAADVVYLAANITDSDAISVESLQSLRSADLPKIAKEKFSTAVASSDSVADAKLKSLGVKDGLEGINFSQCQMDLANDDVILAISYTVEMQFPLFGGNEITMTKTAKAKTFGEILFEVSTKPNVPGWGTTTGDTKVTHGTEVELTATPNYGYVFVEWDDGCTDSTRKVTVTDAQNYVAIFKKDKFGVNTSTVIQYNTANAGIEHKNYGLVSGAGTYEYLDNATLIATPSSNYVFAGWDINGDGVVDSTTPTTTIVVDKVYNVRAYFKPATYTITVKSNNNSYGSAQIAQGSNKGASLRVEYGSNVQLTAASKNSALYIFSKWNDNIANDSRTVTVKGNETYTANFIMNIYTVNFYNGISLVGAVKVIRGSSVNGSTSYTGAKFPDTPSKNGASFGRWKYSGGTFTSGTRVTADTDVYAVWNYTVTLNANGGTINAVSTKTYTVEDGSLFNFSGYTPYRNGFTFNGWKSGNELYSGNATITSNISVNAEWICRHKYDDGTSMLYKENSVGDGGCGECEVITKCKGCSYTEKQKTIGKCEWGANCGVDHIYNWKGGCTHTSQAHKWGTFRCITCKHCGTCKNKRTTSSYGNLIGQADRNSYTYVAGASSKLCGYHNGKNMEKYKKIVSDKAHK